MFFLDLGFPSVAVFFANLQLAVGGRFGGLFAIS